MAININLFQPSDNGIHRGVQQFANVSHWQAVAWNTDSERM